MTTARAIGVVLLLSAACGAKEDFDDRERERLMSLTGLGAPERDLSNAYFGNADAERLGQRLFFDDGFTGKATNVDALGRPVSHGRAPTGTVVTGLSCATCHDPRTGGADSSSEPNHVSIGTGWGAANAPSVINAAHQKMIFWNGRADSLWGMLLPVMESGVVMNSSRLAIAWHIREKYLLEYQAIFGPSILGEFPELMTATATLSPGTTIGECAMSRGVCGPYCRTDLEGKCVLRFPLAGRPGNGTCMRSTTATPPEPYADAFDCMAPSDQEAITRVAVNVAKAIAAYEAKLVVTDSPFDRHLAGTPSLSDAAIRGARLFVGKAACIECHSGPLFSDRAFHNTGVPEGGESVPTVSDCPADGANAAKCTPFGLEAGLALFDAPPWKLYRRDQKYSDAPDDPSRADFIRKANEADRATWRTPGLRNVALTAPYMHNGIFNTLDEVVRFYNWGGSAGAYPPSKDHRMLPLGLTDQESQDLVAFLESLTGPLDEPAFGQRP